MKTILATAIAGTFCLGLAATAHAQAVQIPTPVNPFPANAIATDGSPLPSQSAGRADRLYTGRSVSPFGFVGNVAGAGLDAASGIVGSGLGVR